MKVKIMLDPGHNLGRYNSGAVPGYWEGERMWRLYQLLRPELEARGFVVGCTKQQCDQTVDVVTRGRMARGCVLLLSLHSNACGQESVDRPVGIYFVDDNCGEIDDISKELAVLLSNTVREVMGTKHPAEQYSYQSQYDRDGDGKKNDDYYGVLYGAHQVGVPAIILEHSFHTNRRAAQWLMNDDNLRKLAKAEADALAVCFGVTGSMATPATEKEGNKVEMKTLKPGSEGVQVTVLQALLSGYGYYKGTVDGKFGPKTKTALGAYQADHRDPKTGKQLTVDYSCGPATWRSLLAQ